MSLKTHSAVRVYIATPDMSCGATCWLFLRSEDRSRYTINMGESSFLYFSNRRLRLVGGVRHRRRRRRMCGVRRPLGTCRVRISIIFKQAEMNENKKTISILEDSTELQQE